MTTDPRREQRDVRRSDPRDDIKTTLLVTKGLLAWRAGRLDEADEKLTEALEATRRMAEHQPAIWAKELARRLTLVGQLRIMHRRLDEAEDMYREAVDLFRGLRAKRPQTHREDLAKALINLGAALQWRRKLEAAEAALQEASTIYRSLAAERPKEHKVMLGMTLSAYGGVLWGLRRMEGAEAALRESVEIGRELRAQRRRKRQLPIDVQMASCLTNFGGLLREVGRPEEAEEPLREAVERWRQAERDRPYYAPELAQSLMNYGMLLHTLNRLEPAKTALDEAVAIWRLGLQSREQDKDEVERLGASQFAESLYETYELQLAESLHKLGRVLEDLAETDKAEDAFREAIGVLGDHEAPDNLGARVLSDLGRLLLKQEARLGEAEPFLRDAVEQIESLRAEVLTLDRRLALLRENMATYEARITCLMKLRRYVDALEVAERAKSRTLIDLLTLRDLRPRNAPEDVTREYEQVLFRARALEDALRRSGSGGATDAAIEGFDTGPADPRVERGRLRDELARATGRLSQLAGIIAEHDKDFLPHAAPLGRDEILELASKAEATLVLFRITMDGSYVFVIYPDGRTDAVPVPSFDNQTLDRMIESWMASYSTYQDAVSANLPAQSARDRWLSGMDEILGMLYQSLLKPVHEALRAHEVKDVVLVPNRGLAILPLHACFWEENGNRRYLLDEFNVRYAPSLSVFARCLERERLGRVGDTMLAIANPHPPGNLAFAEWECDEIDRILGTARCLILRRKDATRAEVARLADSQYWLHFSCHAQYRLDAPLDSPLHLAGGERLTMGDIFENLYLPQTWLVSLSACETGLVDFRDVADEHYGLPTAFLYSGVPTVFASLWMVNDLSTALVMTKAYEGVITDKKDKAHALRDAQLWVRDLTAADIVGLLQGQGSHLAPVRRHYEDAYDSGDHPFAHPYWWAAFQCVGA